MKSRYILHSSVLSKLALLILNLLSARHLSSYLLASTSYKLNALSSGP
jgi:hypothetical protein